MNQPVLIDGPAAGASPSELSTEQMTTSSGVSADQVIDLTVDLDQEGPTPPKRVNPMVSVAVAVALVWFSVSSGNTLTLLVAIAFGAMIFLHELGHFLTARLTGMKTTEFFVGFGPRVWSFRRGEMEYGIKAIPLGGYVKILGMHNLDKIEDPADEARTYRQKSYPRRVLVASAGTLMHLLLAFVLLTTVYSGLGESVDTDSQVRVGSIVPTLNGAASPAAASGIRVGEWILSVNGREITGAESLATVINSNPGRPLTMVLGETKNHTSRSVIVTPVGVSTPEGVIGRIGVADLASTTVLAKLPIHTGMGKSIRTIRDFAPLTYKALGSFFTPKHIENYSKVIVNAGEPDATKPIGDNRFMSPIGAVKTVEQATGIGGVRRGLMYFAAINIFVGLFNMLPTLPFDGGHVVIATYERLRSIRRPRYHVDVARLMPVVYLVMFVLMAIGVSSLYLDIRNPI